MKNTTSTHTHTHNNTDTSKIANTQPRKKTIHSQNFQRCNVRHRNVEHTAKNTDILLAQELHLPTNTKQRQMEITKLELKWNRKIYIGTSINDAYMATIVKPHIHNDIVGEPKEPIKGRTQITNIQNEEYNYNIINIYGPPKGCDEMKEFCEELFKEIQHIKDTIMIGDWNNMTHDNMCSKNLNHEHKQKANAIGHYFTEYTDIHTLATNNIRYTFRRQDYLARLDRAYTKPDNIQKILKYRIRPTQFSDHDAIQLELIYGTRPIWGTGSWVLNKEILKNKEYEEDIRHQIQIFYYNLIWSDMLDEWDALKRVIKQTSVRYSSKLKENQDTKCNLEEELKKIMQVIDNGQNTQEN